MVLPSSNAFVFFGAPGYLAHNKIFPALQAMIRHGELDMSVIGVARAGWTLDKLCERARDSLEQICRCTQIICGREKLSSGRLFLPVYPPSANARHP